MTHSTMCKMPQAKSLGKIMFNDDQSRQEIAKTKKAEKSLALE